METKAFGVIDFTVKSVEDDSGSPTGEFYCVLSAPTRDRDGEIVDAKAFDPLPDRITIDVDHTLTVEGTVGSGKPAYEGDLLTVKGTYTSLQRGQDLRTLVNEGHITTMSVVFMNGKREKDQKGVPHVRSGELVNATFCAVPVNRDALVLAAKSLKAGARNSSKDQGHIQAAHDSTVAAGATCAMKAVLGTGKSLSAKAIAGSYEDRREDVLEALVEANTAAIAAAYPNADPGEYGWMLHIVATFDDHVVYGIGWDDDDAFSVTYTWDGEEATITGTPEAVQIDQVVTPAPPDPEAPAAAATAPKAVAATAVSDADSLQIRARALRLVALAAG